jgi:hypothetical protein
MSEVGRGVDCQPRAEALALRASRIAIPSSARPRSSPEAGRSPGNSGAKLTDVNPNKFHGRSVYESRTATFDASTRPGARAGTSLRRKRHNERSWEMKRAITPLSIAACMLVASVGAAPAGQPGTNAGVNCGAIGLTGGITPGNSGSSTNTGSPFAGAMGAGGVYANAFNGSGSQSPNAPVQATSQYDIACFNVTTKSKQAP